MIRPTGKRKIGAMISISNRSLYEILFKYPLYYEKNVTAALYIFSYERDRISPLKVNSKS